MFSITVDLSNSVSPGEAKVEVSRLEIPALAQVCYVGTIEFSRSDATFPVGDIKIFGTAEQIRQIGEQLVKGVERL